MAGNYSETGLTGENGTADGYVLSERKGLRRVAVAYSLPALMLAPLAVSFYVFVPKFYADLGTIGVKSLGLVVLLTRIWDAVTDPLIGFLSDRTVSTRGRRKPWLTRSVLPLCCSFGLLFCVPWLPSGTHLLWFFVFSTLFFLFWTAYAIPYEALGQELVGDYDQRTILFSFRDGAVVVGTLIAAIVPFFADALFADYSSEIRWLFIAVFYSVLLILFTLLCCRGVKDGVIVAHQKTSFSPVKSLVSCLANSHFRILLIAYTVASFGSALPATLFLFYVESVLKSPYGPGFLALYFFIGVATLPIWTKISFRIGKKRCWLAALFINTAGFLGVFMLEAGDNIRFIIFISLSALGYGASLALPSSMQADIIDAEELRTGIRREGEFLGVWSLAKKSAAAIGAGAALWILGTTGFDSTLNVQSPEALFALRALYCLVPCLFSFFAMIAMTNYSLSREVHSEILRSIQIKKGSS